MRPRSHQTSTMKSEKSPSRCSASHSGLNDFTGCVFLGVDTIAHSYTQIKEPWDRYWLNVGKYLGPIGTRNRDL